MEDAITFPEGVVSGGNVDTAVAHYEQERRDLVSRLVKSASQVERGLRKLGVMQGVHLPVSLTFSMLSRTRRITHDELQVRDASYVDGLDRWFQDDQGQKAEASPGVQLRCSRPLT